MGRATARAETFERLIDISIHALRGEGDIAPMRLTIPLMPFQSTPSVGRATIHTDRKPRTPKNFNPRPPWGGRHSSAKSSCFTPSFQSTPSVGRATAAAPQRITRIIISIHALRGEGDLRCFYLCCSNCNFNPRPPWGGRLKRLLRVPRKTQISIHALRGEGDSIYIPCFLQPFYFNPRPPWGGRQLLRLRRDIGRYFNPRPPWGGRRSPH